MLDVVNPLWYLVLAGLYGTWSSSPVTIWSCLALLHLHWGKESLVFSGGMGEREQVS